MPIYPWIKDIFLRIRRGFNKRQNIFILSVTIIICAIGITSVAILLAFKIIDIGVFISSLVAIVVVIFISIYSFWNAFSSRKIQNLLISFLAKGLLTLDDDKLDDLLGLLIQSKLDKLKINPVDELFKTLKKLCTNGDYRMKRRISEALPAIFEISFEHSKELIEDMLRYDWDENWKSDIRRRTIESFRFLSPSQFFFIKDFLEFHEDDQIYTVIAIVEILGFWKFRYNSKEANTLFKKLFLQLSRNNFSKDEIECIEFLWNNFKDIYSDLEKAKEGFYALKDDSNVYKQICIARNLKFLYKRFPLLMLDLMLCFLDAKRDKDVRRPIAKEDSIEHILKLYNHKNCKNKTCEILWKMIKDADFIIRDAIFDRIEIILDKDRIFGEKIIEYLKNNEVEDKLRKNAEKMWEKIRV